MSWHCDGNVFIMSFGMLSGPGALSQVNRLTHLSYTSRVKWVLISVVYGPCLSNIIPSCVCHGYFRIVHMHVFG